VTAAPTVAEELVRINVTIIYYFPGAEVPLADDSSSVTEQAIGGIPSIPGVGNPRPNTKDPSVTPGFYDDTDWSALPDDIRAAAEVLGYDEFSWDGDTPAPVEDLDWEELSPEQQAAAAVLGFDQASWDDSSKLRRRLRPTLDDQGRRRQQEEMMPVDAEVDQLIENTLNFYIAVFQGAYPENFRDLVPAELQAGPLAMSRYRLSYTADLLFTSAPDEEDVGSTISTADYSDYVINFVQPSGPYFFLTIGVSVSDDMGPLAVYTVPGSTVAPTAATAPSEETVVPTVATATAATVVPTAATVAPTVADAPLVATAAPTAATVAPTVATVAPTVATAAPTSVPTTVAIEASTAPPTSPPTTQATQNAGPLVTTTTEAPTVAATVATVRPTVPPTSIAPEVLTETPTIATTTATTLAPTSVTSGDATDVPSVSGSNETDVPLTNGTDLSLINATDVPIMNSSTPVPIMNSSTAAPSGPDGCNTIIGQNGNMTFGFFFADRGPNDDEEQALASATFDFFSATFQEAFPDSFVNYSGEVNSTNFMIDKPVEFELGFLSQTLFSPCAPPLEDFQQVLDNANYDAVWQEYLDVGEDPNSVLVFIESASYEGEISYL